MKNCMLNHHNLCRNLDAISKNNEEEAKIKQIEHGAPLVVRYVEHHAHQIN